MWKAWWVWLMVAVVSASAAYAAIPQHILAGIGWVTLVLVTVCAAAAYAIAKNPIKF